MNYKIILASNSPRRKELLAGLDIPFEVKVISGIDESYPADLDAYQVAEFICKKKAEAYRPLLNGNNSVGELDESETLILTADTVVIATTAGEQNDQEGKGHWYLLLQPRRQMEPLWLLLPMSVLTRLSR